jgi:predicted  nucleic acid-binding Zn-ribbon protein
MTNNNTNNNSHKKKGNYLKNKIQDLEETLELREGEIDELNMELTHKNKQINKLNSHILKNKYEKDKLEYKLKTEINNEKAHIKELNDLEEKVNDKVLIIEDKHDQVKYLRGLIEEYKSQIHSNSENLELQLRKIGKTYEGLLAQKDNIISKQDERINELIRTNEHLVKVNKANIISLELQNENYRKLLREVYPDFKE